MDKNQISVVMPVYKKFEELNWYELISWKQCINVLSAYDIILIYPDGLCIKGYLTDAAKNKKELIAIAFNPLFFKDIYGYNHLMLSIAFYTKFEQYTYLLIHQLDAFIFRDELLDWGNKGYAYIGAPWFEGFNPAVVDKAGLWKVGNGGFSLRDVQKFIRVLKSFSIIDPWPLVVKKHFLSGRKKGVQNLHRLFKQLLFSNNTYWRLNDVHKRSDNFQEDYFWGAICNEKFNWFNVASANEALHFSFEMKPAKMYALNQNRLPMGCHGWQKFDTPFWKPHIEKYGYAFKSSINQY